MGQVLRKALGLEKYSDNSNTQNTFRGRGECKNRHKQITINAVNAIIQTCTEYEKLPDATLRMGRGALRRSSLRKWCLSWKGAEDREGYNLFTNHGK